MSSIYRNAATKSIVSNGFSVRSIFMCCVGGKGGRSKASSRAGTRSVDQKQLLATNHEAEYNEWTSSEDERNSGLDEEEIADYEIDSDGIDDYEIDNEDAHSEDSIGVASIASLEAVDSDSDRFKRGDLSIRVGMTREIDGNNMIFHIRRVRGVPSVHDGGSTKYMVRARIVSSNKKIGKVRDKTPELKGPDPYFQKDMEVMNKIPPDQIENCALRLRLYGCERKRLDKLIGEVILEISQLIDIVETRGNGAISQVMLESRTKKNKSKRKNFKNLQSVARGNQLQMKEADVSSVADEYVTQELPPSPDACLFIGLAYNGPEGLLTVQVIQGAGICLTSIKFKSPDSYVKVILKSADDKEFAKCKTRIERRQMEPHYTSKFMYKMGRFQLKEITIYFDVYCRKTMTESELIGSCVIGSKSYDVGEEQWARMLASQGERVDQWHILQPKVHHHK